MNNQFSHKIFALVGPSGVGKSVILKGVLKKIPELKIIPSYTTRPKRSAEKEGWEHFFVTIEEFKQLINGKKLLEYEQVHPGTFYGMPLAQTRERLQKDNLIRDIDILGSQSLKKFFPEQVVIIFIKPPNLNELKARITKRGEHSGKEIKERLSRINFEMERAHLADYLVVNDKLPMCIKEVAEIIRKEIQK